MFVSKGRYAKLQSEHQSALEELERLREWSTRSGLTAVLDTEKLLTEQKQELAKTIQERERLLATAHAERDALLVASKQEHQELTAEIKALREALVQTNEMVMLQEVGVYEFAHPLDDAVAYKQRLDDIRAAAKDLVASNRAVTSITNWTVNGSAREGIKMVRDTAKLMLGAYNSEVENVVRTVRPHRLQASVDRLDKLRERIARNGSIMQLRISDEYHRIRVSEVRLTSDYLRRQEEERERLREERDAQREEQKARREMEAEKARLIREAAKYETAIVRMQAAGDDAAVAELQAKVAEIGNAILAVEAREANIRAGFVYIVSNIGAFGERMVKIGLTRRLDPEDRIRELGDASVPFRFDKHALIFSDDAVSLETRLHGALAAKRVNQVNLRREFFHATPSEVLNLLKEMGGQYLTEFHEIAEAEEWRQSEALRAKSI